MTEPTDIAMLKNDDFSIAEILDGDDTKPSSEIYRNLASDPVFSYLSTRKKLSYRELLLVVSTVVSSLDKELLQLRKSEERLVRLKSFVNAPLLEPYSESKGRDGSQESGPSPAEAHWFLKYLSLRNVLGALVLTLSLSGGFFAWWNQDYRSLLDARKERVSELEKLNNSFANTIKERDKELAALRNQLGAAEGRLQGAEDHAKSLESSIEKLQTASGAQSVVAESAESLKVDLEKIRGEKEQYRTAATEWQTKYNEQNNKISDKDSLLTQKDLELSKRDGQVRDAVDAWNQLLTYLYSKSNGGMVEVKSAYLKDQLKSLSEYTSRVPNMKQELR